MWFLGGLCRTSSFTLPGYDKDEQTCNYWLSSKNYPMKMRNEIKKSMFK